MFHLTPSLSLSHYLFGGRHHFIWLGLLFCQLGFYFSLFYSLFKGVDITFSDFHPLFRGFYFDMYVCQSQASSRLTTILLLMIMISPNPSFPSFLCDSCSFILHPPFLHHPNQSLKPSTHASLMDHSSHFSILLLDLPLRLLPPLNGLVIFFFKQKKGWGVSISKCPLMT